MEKNLNQNTTSRLSQITRYITRESFANAKNTGKKHWQSISSTLKNIDALLVEDELILIILQKIIFF
jgi:hypothetical protein